MIYQLVSWGAVFNVSSPKATSEAGVGMAVFGACFLASLPAGIVERVQLGYQEGFVNGLWAAAGSLIGLIGVLLGIHLRAGLPWLVLAIAGAPLLAQICNGLMLFGRRRPWLRPSVRVATRAASTELMRLGGLFFLLQLAVALLFASDNIIVARLFGARAVTQYSVPMRMFSVVPIILVILFNPLWPAYGEAMSRGDAHWARKTLGHSLLLAVGVTALASAILVMFGVQIAHLWVGSSVTPSFWLLLGLGLWAVLSAAGNALAMFLNGVNLIRFQVYAALATTPVALLLKFVLGRSFGLSGVIWATVIAYAAFTAVPFAVVTPRLLRRVARRQENPVALVS